MPAPRPRNTRSLRALARGLVALVLALQVGCASQVAPGELAAFEGMRGPISSFSQHPMVCAPTSVGNAMGGLIGAPLALLVYPFVWPATWFTEDDDYLRQTYGTTFWGPVLLGGGMTGALFLPPAMLFEDSPCDFGTSATPIERKADDEEWGADDWLEEEPESSDDDEMEE